MNTRCSGTDLEISDLLTQYLQSSRPFASKPHKINNNVDCELGNVRLIKDTHKMNSLYKGYSGNKIETGSSCFTTMNSTVSMKLDDFSNITGGFANIASIAQGRDNASCGHPVASMPALQQSKQHQQPKQKRRRNTTISHKTPLNQDRRTKPSTNQEREETMSKLINAKSSFHSRPPSTVVDGVRYKTLNDIELGKLKCLLYATILKKKTYGSDKMLKEVPDGKASRNGAVGIMDFTEDDNMFVMGCAAKLKNKSVETNNIFERTLLPEKLTNYHIRGKCTSANKEKNYMQKRCTKGPQFGQLCNKRSNLRPKQISESTQVNFNSDPSHKNVNYICANSKSEPTKNIKKDAKSPNKVASGKDPFVIISVYKYKEAERNEVNKISLYKSRGKVHSPIIYTVNNASCKVYEKEKGKNISNDSNIINNVHRSRSPAKHALSPKINMENEKNHEHNYDKLSNIKQESPMHDTSTEKPSKNLETINNKISYKRNVKEVQNQIETSNCGNHVDVHPQKLSKENTPRRNQKNNHVIYNLLDDVLLRDNISKEAVHMEGEREICNVLYRNKAGAKHREGRQDKNNLTGIQRIHYRRMEGISSASLNNLLNEVTKHSVINESSSSQTPTINSDQGVQVSNVTNRIFPEDTVKFTHRQHTISRSRYFYASCNGSSKHYKGDGCSIIDPMERDKEVRTLLGVKWCKDRTLKSTVKRKKPNVNDQPVQVDTRELSEWKNVEMSNSRRVDVATQYEMFADDSQLSQKQLIFNIEAQSYQKNDQLIFQMNMTKPKPLLLSKSQYNTVKKNIQMRNYKQSQQKKAMPPNNAVFASNLPQTIHNTSMPGPRREKAIQTLPLEVDFNGDITSGMSLTCKDLETESDESLYSGASVEYVMRNTNRTSCVREPYQPIIQTMSSIELRYINNSMYTKSVQYSAQYTKVDTSFTHVSDDEGFDRSMHTIFKGERRSVTPNLSDSGQINSRTSVYGDGNPEKFNNTSINYILSPRLHKRRPFLRRLISLLVIRTKTSQHIKRAVRQPAKAPEFSVDSYHISTSLGAIEMSSSIYDTSTSFYSNHSILPVNAKLKRNFFSTFRGILKKNY